MYWVVFSVGFATLHPRLSSDALTGLSLQSYFFEPLLDVEAGAGTVGELVVAMDGGDRVLFHQVADELEEGETLGFGAGVGGVAVGIEAADISDANALGVVTWAMGTDLFDGTASVDAAVRVHDIMIAYVVPSEALVVVADALHGAVGIGAGSGAMDDDFGDCSHFFVGLMGLMGLMGVFGLRRCRSIRNNRMDRGDRYDRVLERGLGWILAPALSGSVWD